jgi:hypothetical protein
MRQVFAEQKAPEAVEDTITGNALLALQQVKMIAQHAGLTACVHTASGSSLSSYLLLPSERALH